MAHDKHALPGGFNEPRSQIDCKPLIGAKSAPDISSVHCTDDLGTRIGRALSSGDLPQEHEDCHRQ
jgi:hypothetical protein